VAQQVRGIVARSKGAPVTVETIVVPDPGPGEAVVKIQACGVCHTDLHYREGGINDDFPFLLGHEAAGVVESVGDGVTDVAPGDFVILNWRAVCGDCRACRRGRPQYCFATHNATQKMTLTDGTELAPALGIGAFVEKTLVAAGQCTKVDPAAPPEVAGLLGCGVMAGIGAAINTGQVGRGDTVAVFGCGGVGDAAIAGAASSPGPRSSGRRTPSMPRSRTPSPPSRRSPSSALMSPSTPSATPLSSSRRTTPATLRVRPCSWVSRLPTCSGRRH
jgi:S-(hydroxymethyl)mycothiol dehydrogenase